jgi:Ser/Thr protein kinase RdoA (MazF antagonist)
MNEHWRVGEFVLRRYAAYRSAPSVAWELDLLRWLSGAGIPVPRPVDALESCGRMYALFYRLRGRVGASFGGDPFQRGQELARLHLTLAEYRSDRRPGFSELLDLEHRCVYWLEGDHRGLLAAVDALDPGAKRRVTAELERLRADLSRLDLAALPRHVIHGDFQGGNIAYGDGKIAGIFDFDLAHRDLRAADIAIAVNFTGQLDRVVSGYDSVARLSEEERYVVRPALRAFHLHHAGKNALLGFPERSLAALERVRMNY